MIYETDNQQDYIINTDNAVRVRDFFQWVGLLKHRQDKSELSKQHALAHLANVIVAKCGYDAFSSYSIGLGDDNRRPMYLEGFNSEGELVQFYKDNVEDIKLAFNHDSVEYFLQCNSHLFGEKLRDRKRNITCADLAVVYTGNHTDNYYYYPVACAIASSVVELIGYEHLWFCGEKSSPATDGNSMKTPDYTRSNKGLAYPYIIYAPTAKSVMARCLIDEIGFDNFVIQAKKLDTMDSFTSSDLISRESGFNSVDFFVRHAKAVNDWCQQDLNDDLSHGDHYSWLQRLSIIIGWEKWRYWDKQEVINAIMLCDTTYVNFNEVVEALITYMTGVISRDFIHFCKTNGYAMNNNHNVGGDKEAEATNAYHLGYEQAKADIMKSIMAQTA